MRTGRAQGGHNGDGIVQKPPPRPLPHVITTAEALAELAGELEPAAAIGLDTEFLRERTYRAQLCLLQICLLYTSPSPRDA